MTTAKPGERGHCLVHDEGLPLQACTCNPRPAGATTAPQAEAVQKGRAYCGYCGSELTNDLATQRDELADALEALLTAYCGTAEMQQAEIDQAAAALKKAGRR